MTIMVHAGKEVVGSGMGVALASRGNFLQPKNKWRRKAGKRNDRKRSHPSAATLQGAYEPPRLRELQKKNRLKTRKYFPKSSRVPGAPRNTSSFIMRAKKAGGFASLVSPAVPASFSTRFLSPAPVYREVLVDEVNSEWGVDGYGSMNGLIRLRCPGNSSQDCGGSFDLEYVVDEDSHAESVRKLERRIDHGLSRFEIVYPLKTSRNSFSKPIEVRVEEQENLIARLEDENLSLKENLYLLKQELEYLQGRLPVHLGTDGLSEEDSEVCADRKESLDQSVGS